MSTQIDIFDERNAVIYNINNCKSNDWDSGKCGCHISFVMDAFPKDTFRLIKLWHNNFKHSVDLKTFLESTLNEKDFPNR